MTRNHLVGPFPASNGGWWFDSVDSSSDSLVAESGYPKEPGFMSGSFQIRRGDSIPRERSGSVTDLLKPEAGSETHSCLL